MDTIDFRPTTTAMTRLLAELEDRELGGPTPCPAYAVADLVEHVVGLTTAFTHAARKDPLPPELMRDGDGSQLPDEWRTAVASDLDALADAWAEPAAYDGTTMAGPVELPAREAALVALDELVVHGWDLARATGREWRPDTRAVTLCTEFVAGFEAPANDPTDEGGGLFGPPVATDEGADDLDRLVAMTGRDPRWSPGH